ncbi:hypothetical protein K440DRAFT_616194 [Wilcoxina mikolae CBS 423.85]|nr:hypothetical protein K440DRAFT_616194 [Wilcoxina mikolae CBS 423.85]
MLKSVKGLQQLVFQIIGTETARQQALLVQQQAKETQMQVKLAQGQAEETRIQVQLSKSAQEQGKSVLVFTIITTVFLPLSFFTSYFGMNTTDIRGTDMTQRTFWTYCGPISAFVVLVALLVAFRRKLLKRKSDEELAEAEALQKQD